MFVGSFQRIFAAVIFIIIKAASALLETTGDPYKCFIAENDKFLFDHVTVNLVGIDEKTCLKECLLAQLTRGFICRSANYFSNKECSLLAIERSGTNDQKYTTRERVTHFENTCHLQSRYHNLHQNFTHQWPRAAAIVAGPGVHGLVEIVEIPLREWDEQHIIQHGLPEITVGELGASIKQPAFVYGVFTNLTAGRESMLIVYNLMHFSTIDDCIGKEYISSAGGFQIAKLFPSSSKSVLVMEPQIIDLYHHDSDYKTDLIGATCAVNQLVVYPSAEKSDEIRYEYTKVLGCGILEEETYDESKQKFHVSSAATCWSMFFTRTFDIMFCSLWLFMYL